MDINRVGIVGCGIMGAGIVEAAARAGYSVRVSEAGRELLDKGLASIDNALSADVKRARMTEADKAAVSSRITGTVDLADLKDCDLVIEAVSENLELKKKIFAALDKACPAQTVLATNTSCLSVIDLAAATGRQDKVVGIHFFNPVSMMKLVELVKTIAVSEETLLSARAFAEKLGKTVVIAPDTPGFIVNRVLAALLLEAIRLLESGQVTREDLDKAIRLGLNHPMGPLGLSDLIGLDTELSICEGLFEDFKDDRFAPPILLKRMVASGQLGRKTGKGFFNYPK
jgi:3-hydroxybutyryl-CoA dehydrogenase